MKRGGSRTPVASPKQTLHRATPSGGRIVLLFASAVCVFIVVHAFWLPSSSDSESLVVNRPRADNAKQTPATTAFALPDACSFVNYTNDRDGMKEHFRRLLLHLLSFGPRVGGSGTAGYFGVMQALVRMMSCTGDKEMPQWTLSFDNFTEATPIGTMQFTNLVSEIENPYFLNGDAQRIDRSKRRTFPTRTGIRRLDHLVLSAQWDSKLMDGKPFLGACDSAVPILLALELMKLVQSTLAQAPTSSFHRAVARNLLPKKISVIFFDGEEAFVEWKGADHTYGSRHLSNVWASNGKMGTVDLFVLLDLMGPPLPKFHNYFSRDSGAFYEALSAMERRLVARGRLSTRHSMFPTELSEFPSKVDDDHIHWIQHAPVLHLIPLPFPSVWHTPADDAAAIDLDTVVDLYLVLSHGLISFPLRG